MKNKNIVCSSVYEGGKCFLDEFLNSILNQTKKDFDFLIFNDGLSNLEGYMSKFSIDYKIIEFNGSLTPATIREKAIEYAIENEYENFVFADSDDICDRYKIEKIVEMLKVANIVFTDMKLINKESEIISNSYYDGILFKKEFSINDIIDKNYIGFSNMGIKTSYLKYCLPIDKKLIAVDWWVVSNAAIYTDKILYIDEPLTFYRQYEKNTVGAMQIIDAEMLNKAVNVKKKHYKDMSIKFKETEFGRIYKENYIEMIRMEEYLRKKINVEKVLFLLNESKRNYAWWECAISLKDLEEMENEYNRIKG